LREGEPVYRTLYVFLFAAVLCALPNCTLTHAGVASGSFSISTVESFDILVYYGKLIANDNAIHPELGEIQVLTIDDVDAGPVTAVCMGAGNFGVQWCMDELTLGQSYFATVELNTDLLPGQTVPVLLDMQEIVFADGFESGDASAWSVVVGGGG
jgi:hypothetical protein